MKYMKRKQIYQASNYNVTFDPKAVSAFSYRWWKFVGVVEGKLVFNNYYYSPSTAKHQSKVRSLLNQLNIKIDIEMPVPKGLPGSWRRSYSMGDTVTPENATLQDLITQAEEYLCDKFLSEMIKRQERYQRTKARKLKKRLEDYLENQVHFRDYDITSKDYFGHPGYSISTKVAVHQIVENDSLERDVENAIYSFQRDGFGSIVFYVEGL